jgi:hypothetical protein
MQCVRSLSPVGSRRHAHEVTNLDWCSSSRSRCVRHRHHQEAAGTGGSREDDGMGVSDVRLVDAKTGKWRFISHRFD